VSPTAPAPGPEVSPRDRLAAALRPISSVLVASELDDEVLIAAAVEVEALAARLAAASGPRRARVRPIAEVSAERVFPASPVIGPENPVAPPVRLEVVEGPDGSPEVRGEAYFDYPYEGPPGCVHGGVIAETFDEILGVANLATGNPGMTGSLTVRYRKPTPLRTDLQLEARYLRRTGRKISTWAAIYHGNLLTAEAEGLFIEVGPAAMLAIAESGAAGADPALLAELRAESVRLAAAGDGVPG
jgi:hypothetical protein